VLLIVYEPPLTARFGGTVLLAATFVEPHCKPKNTPSRSSSNSMAWEQTKDSWNNTNDEVKDLVARWQEIQRKSLFLLSDAA